MCVTNPKAIRPNSAATSAIVFVKVRSEVINGVGFYFCRVVVFVPNNHFFAVLNRYPKARIHIQGDLKYPGLGNSSVWAQFASPFQGKISPPRTFNCEGYQFLSYIRSSSFAEEAVKMDPENKKILTTTVKRHGCFLCDEGFITADELIQHRRSLRHRRNYCAHMYRLNRPELIKPKLGMKFDLGVKEEGAKYQAQAGKEGFEVVTEPKKEIEVKFLLRNVQETGDNVVLKSVELLESNTDYWLTDKYGVTKPVEMREPAIKPGVRVKPTRSFAFSFHARCDNIGQTRIPIVAQIRPDKGGSQLAHMAMELILKVESPDMDVIAPKTPFERPKRVNPFAKSALETAIPGLKLVFSSEKVKAKVALRQYPMPRDVKIFLASSGKIHDGLKSTEIPDIEKKNYLLRQKMSAENYCQRFQLLLYAEEKQMEVDIRRYDMSNVKMDLRPNKLFYLEVLGLAENRPSVLKGDSLIVNFNNDRTKTYEGVVHEVHDLGVLLGFSKRLADKFIPGNRFDVQFTFNRFPLRTMHRAVEHINVKNFMPIFPINPPVKAPKVNPASINFINRKIAHNLEQSEAVANIVKGDLIGAPYVVFGPPGTGKTVTVVEAMLQLYKTQKVRILACAPSNSAADLIAVRLLETVSPADILRIYAQSRDPKKVPESISKHRVSNFARPQCDGNFVEIMKYKVVVTTLVNAGRLLSAGIPKEHFTHLFIDEAGHATEPEAMIPIGLIDPAKGKIVLAGDPKQLGPVLRSPIALKHGLQLSYLERMMSSPEFRHYQPDKRGKYDPRFITKLLNNFRSHESILKLPSEMFYANELRVMADKDVREEFCKWEHLANPDFPIVFHSVIGEDKREGNSPSFFNPGEAAIVVEYLEKLINGVGRFKPKGKEIGVISPYRRQVQKIKDLMNHKFQRTRLDWKGITVGSTEEFQGQERRIIIISTVRSQEQYIRLDSDHQLGFLRNPKRFNVALTRAKALMIIVGNPNLLKLDPHWNRFIQYVFTNGGFKGSIPFEPWTGQQGDDGLKMLQEKMIRLGIYNGNDAEDDDEVEETSDLQLYAEPEWRADF